MSAKSNRQQIPQQQKAPPPKTTTTAAKTTTTLQPTLDMQEYLGKVGELEKQLQQMNSSNKLMGQQIISAANSTNDQQSTRPKSAPTLVHIPKSIATQSMHHQSMGVKKELLNDIGISHNNPAAAAAAAVPRRGQSCFTRYEGDEAWMNDITTKDGEVGGKRARVEQNQQGQPLNKKPLLGIPGGPSDIGLPKPPVDDILKMKGPDCTKELRKIKSAQVKAGLSNKHQIHISGRVNELQIRLVDYYYPSYDGITTVLLPKGCCDFDVEKSNDWMLKVTTIGKGFELFGVGSIILSINKEPLSTKYTNGGNLMDMACRLFKGEIKKHLNQIP